MMGKKILTLKGVRSFPLENEDDSWSRKKKCPQSSRPYTPHPCRSPRAPRVPQPQPWAAPSTREREAQPSAASRPASCACTPPGDSGARKAPLSRGSVNALAKATRKRTRALSPPRGQQWNNRAWGRGFGGYGVPAIVEG